MKKVLFGIFVIAFGNLLLAQNNDWVDQMNDHSVNFYTVKQNFEEYWQEREIEKGKGYKQFQRWAAFMEPRVYPEGNRPAPGILAEEYEQLQQNSGSANLGQWKPMGPYDGSTMGSTMGIGRINRVRFDPNNPQIVWAGTPAGGLWKSTDGGVNWSTNTDHLTNLGVTDIAIDPNDPSIMYLATGDRDGGDTYSFGILKSTDGGATWNPTGLSFNVQSQVRVSDVYINPDNTDVLIAVTRSGIYRSTDAAASWSRIQTGSYNGLVQKPGDPNVLFTSSYSGSNCRILKSTDNGMSWNILSDSNLPTGNARRIELAVTPADPNYIYALYGASNNGFEGIYRSTNGGSSWTQQANSPNLLGWNTSGTDQGGQAWYDLALAVNPTNRNEVYVGGVNIWKSNNGGSNWSMAAHWFGGGGNPFVHADIHHLTFQPGTNHLYAGTDGGVYRHRSGQFNWDELNDGMNITQYYRISASVTDTNVMLAGAQDNGTHRLNASGWAFAKGGDGMDCAVNTKNPSIMYASSQYGNFAKSTNGGNTFHATFNLPNNLTGAWVTPIKLDPHHPDTLYIGFSQVYRSYDGGLNFSTISPSSMTGGSNLDQLAIAPNHTNIIFASQGDRLWKSTDYGDNWSNLSSGVPGSAAITCIAIDYGNPDHVLITRSGYASNQKVYESFDGGSSWNNISQDLPNIPANCITIENNAETSMYLGTDLGVFYRDSLTNSWISFNSDLPNVIVNDLEINYENRKLRAATYGRGVWESPLYSDLVPPVSKVIFPGTVCVNDTVSLQNISEYNPEKFSWHVEPSSFIMVNGTDDSTKSPQIVFTQQGIYNISLVSENQLGKDSAFFVSAVAVGGFPLPYTTGFENLFDIQHWSTTEDGAWDSFESAEEISFKASLFNDTDSLRHELISPAINLSDHDSAWLSFDHAYSGTASNYGDSLLVYAAPGCSENFSLLGAFGEDGSNNFRTATGISSAFLPSASDWCGSSGMAGCTQINLSAFAGMESVRLKFVAVSAGGNDLYIDNISINGNPTAGPTAAFGSQTEVCALDFISFSDQSYGSPETWEWSFVGPDTLSSVDRNAEMLFEVPGTYEVRLKVDNGMGVDSVVKASYLTVNPADSVDIQMTYSTDTLCPGSGFQLDLSATNTGTNPVFTWYRNSAEAGTGDQASFQYDELENGDTLYASVQSELNCAYPYPAFTDTIIVNVYPKITPVIHVPGILCSTDSAFVLSATPSGGSFSGNGVSGGAFDPDAAGLGSHEITYTYTDSSGCTMIEKTYIGVTSPVNLSLDPVQDACVEDQPVNLNYGKPIGGHYSGQGVHSNKFYPDSAGVGTHTLVYTYNTSYCGSPTISFDITVHPAPDTPEVWVNNNLLESSIAASAYQWHDQNGPVSGATSKTFGPTVDGSYLVEIFDANGCSSKSEYASFNVGIKEFPDDLSFKIYPNPAKDRVNLEIESTENYNLNLSIYNSVGALVDRIALDFQGNFNQVIDVQNLPSGIYLFDLEGNDVLIRQKIVVQ